MKLARFVAVVSTSVVVAVLAFVGLNFVQVLYVGDHPTSSAADAIVVMGAAQYDGVPSPQLASRLDHALELFQQGRAPIIAVTGGNKPGDRFTEAQSSRIYLVERGVPATAIVDEDRGRSTWESVANLTPVLKSLGIRTLIVVTDRYHVQRTLLSFREAGMRARGSATPTSPIHPRLARQRAMKESFGVSIARFIGFRHLWQVTG